MTFWNWLFFLLIAFAISFWLIRRTSRSPAQKFTFSNPHDCGPRALLSAIPELPHSKIKDAFMQCTDKWPNGGVTNVEFNVALRYMKIFDRFKYNDADGQVMGDFLVDETGTYILLIHGHFTTIKGNKIYDSLAYTNPNPKQVVYCSWQLIE